jgi:putative phosphoesterase
MKLALFSDVHGNLTAFRAVVSAMRQDAPDRYVFCGDLCGYYYDQNEIVTLMQELQPLTAVSGNHDALFLDQLANDSLLDAYTARYGSSNRRLKANLAPETKAFIASLPMKAEIPEISALVVHGSPWDPLNEYIYPTMDIKRFETLPYRWVFMGHSHYPMHRQAGTVNLVNPGSCGQPRDQWQASYALVDAALETVIIRRIAYDTIPVIQQIQANDPAVPYLGDVLRRGAEISS